MHIVMLSDLETEGGAARAAARLATALSQAGHRVTRVVYQSQGGAKDWTTVELPVLQSPRRPVRIARRLVPASALGGWNRYEAAKTLDSTLRRLAPDVINVHNLHFAVKAGWSPHLLGVCLDHAP